MNFIKRLLFRRRILNHAFQHVICEGPLYERFGPPDSPMAWQAYIETRKLLTP